MSSEAAFIDLLRAMAQDPAARGLADDCAVLEIGGARLVLTSDTLVEGVHYLADDPPDSIGWKLAAVNLSDLASKGARPVACLMNYALSGDAGWDAAFVAGLGQALDRYGMPLVGGDTVAMPAGAPRSYTLTAIGEAGSGAVPSRSGARVGDLLCITGAVGDAGHALMHMLGGRDVSDMLRDAYRRPVPRMAEGQALAPIAHAMMDVSDGLLIDAKRIADASGVGVAIEHVPLSAAIVELHGRTDETRLRAATMGDDYELLVAIAPDAVIPGALIPIGRFVGAPGMTLTLDGRPVPLPDRLGYEHLSR